MSATEIVDNLLGEAEIDVGDFVKSSSMLGAIAKHIGTTQVQRHGRIVDRYLRIWRSERIPSFTVRMQIYLITHSGQNQYSASIITHCFHGGGLIDTTSNDYPAVPVEHKEEMDRRVVAGIHAVSDEMLKNTGAGVYDLVARVKKAISQAMQQSP